MGNQAIALGAIHAGVGLVSGYPGTPSTEILETVAARRGEDTYVEWSVNEKAALEVAAGAAYAGVRAMVTMKQVGLNVASDPLMSLAYVGVKGGMVVVVADDPGPISSQTEQDTRNFAAHCKLPVFDPESPEEAYRMVRDAFELSEKYGTPVLLRPTTRVCHGCASVELREPLEVRRPQGFQKDSSRWVIFPRLSYRRHGEIEERNRELTHELSEYGENRVSGAGRLAVAAGGVSRAYVKEALELLGEEPRLLEVATPFPFPEDLALEFLKGVDQVLVAEELDPVIERALLQLIGCHHLPVEVKGKLMGEVPANGENSVELMKGVLAKYLGLPAPSEPPAAETPELPVRPPVLCAGCPHRASFYAVKQAMKGRKAVFSGDIGCYTLGNAAPLDMVDTCLCMGAGVTVAQGLHRAEPDAVNFGFLGDSTFFASGITGVVNAVYNQTRMVLVVLDNSTTAMTGHQPHPGTGETMMGDVSQKIEIADLLEAIGVESVEIVDPLDLEEAVEAVKSAADCEGVSAVIFRSPCIAVTRGQSPWTVDAEKCTGCFKCVRELGCPALYREDGKVKIDPAQCTGCGLCGQVCPFGAIKGGRV